MYYVRAVGKSKTGKNTDKWLKILNVTKQSEYDYKLEVRFEGKKHYALVTTKDISLNNMEFAEGWPTLKPVGLNEVIKNTVGAS